LTVCWINYDTGCVVFPWTRTFSSRLDSPTASQPNSGMPSIALRSRTHHRTSHSSEMAFLKGNMCLRRERGNRGYHRWVAVALIADSPTANPQWEPDLTISTQNDGYMYKYCRSYANREFTISWHEQTQNKHQFCTNLSMSCTFTDQSIICTMWLDERVCKLIESGPCATLDKYQLLH
jgi:hypothetical protein